METNYSLNIGLGSLGESVSGLYACRQADQLTEADFNSLDALAFKLENGLLKLVESLERKQETGDWIDSLVVNESNVAYGSALPDSSQPPPLHHSTTPPLHHSITPSLHRPITP
jgi:hypothetical protein